MRAPFQILALPYMFKEGQLLFCVFHRADHDQWQFISGGGEDRETPLEAAEREIQEESGIRADTIIPLTAMAYIPADVFPKVYRENWTADIYIIPEYAFAFPCSGDIHLSQEHTACVWLPYEEAKEKLKWDSNRTALYELYHRLCAGSLNQCTTV